MHAILVTHLQSVEMLMGSRRAPQAGRHVALIVWCRCGMAQQAEAPQQRMAGRGGGSRDNGSTDARRATDGDDAKRWSRVPRGCQARQAGQADRDCVATGRGRQPWLLDEHRGCRWRKRLLAGGHVGAERTTSRHSSDRLGAPETALLPSPSPDKRSVPRVLDPPEPAWTKRDHGKVCLPSAISINMRLAIGVVHSRPSQPDVNPCSNHPGGDAL